MTYQFQTSDLVCSRMIEIELDDRGERVKRVQFVGGCPGNLLGISRIVIGMKAEDVLMRPAGRLYRARCGNGEGRLFSVPGFFGGKLDNGPKCVYVNCKLSV